MESNHRRTAFQAVALPTELPMRTGSRGWIRTSDFELMRLARTAGLLYSAESWRVDGDANFAGHPFRQHSQRPVFTVLMRCIDAAPGGAASTHFGQGPETLATACVANADEIERSPCLDQGGMGSPLPHDTKLLTNAGFPIR